LAGNDANVAHAVIEGLVVFFVCHATIYAREIRPMIKIMA